MKERYDGILDVFVQPPNKTHKREWVGCITDGHRPLNDDYRRWGINPDNVVQHKVIRWKGERCMLVVSI